MTIVIEDRWKARRGTAADLAAVNEVPLDGEVILETDTGLGKIGDGVTHYNDLLYRLIGDIDLTGLADGKILIRKEDSNGLRWILSDPPVKLPPDGFTGQVLTKISDDDQDADWEDSSSGTRVTWNPDDCSGQGILCNSDTVLTYAPQSSTGPIAVRATKSFSAGKRYFEVNLNEPGASVFSQVGLMDNSGSLDSSVGANGWSYYQQTGQKDDHGTLSSFGAVWTTRNDRLGIAFDLDAGMIWFARNNVWQASGDPATGANPAFSGVSGTLFPACSTYGSNGASLRGIFRSSLFKYAPPTGFLAVEQ